MTNIFNHTEKIKAIKNPVEKRKAINNFADCLRFKFGWNYWKVTRFLTRKFGIDELELDEIFYEHDKPTPECSK